jgi:hypothetical protein
MDMIEWFMNNKEMLKELPPDKLQKLHELVKAKLVAEQAKRTGMPPGGHK